MIDDPPPRCNLAADLVAYPRLIEVDEKALHGQRQHRLKRI